MANATAPGTRTTEPVGPPTGSPRWIARAVPLAARPLAALWAIIVVALAGLLAFGVVRVGAGFWDGRRMSLREIWGQFAGFLADKGFTPGLITGVTLLLLASLALAAIFLWFAFMLKDAELEHEPAPDDIPRP